MSVQNGKMAITIGQLRTYSGVKRNIEGIFMNVLSLVCFK